MPGRRIHTGRANEPRRCLFVENLAATGAWQISVTPDVAPISARAESLDGVSFATKGTLTTAGGVVVIRRGPLKAQRADATETFRVAQTAAR